MLYCTFYYSTLDQEETPRDEPKKIGALIAYSFQYDAYVNRSIQNSCFCFFKVFYEKKYLDRHRSEYAYRRETLNAPLFFEANAYSSL